MVKKTYHKKSSRKSKKLSRKNKNKGKGLTPDIENQYDKITTYNYLPNFKKEKTPDIENQLETFNINDHRKKLSSSLFNILQRKKNTRSTTSSSNDYGQFVNITPESKGRGLKKKHTRKSKKSRKSRKSRKSKKSRK